MSADSLLWGELDLELRFIFAHALIHTHTHTSTTHISYPLSSIYQDLDSKSMYAFWYMEMSSKCPFHESLTPKHGKCQPIYLPNNQIIIRTCTYSSTFNRRGRWTTKKNTHTYTQARNSPAILSKLVGTVVVVVVTSLNRSQCLST